MRLTKSLPLIWVLALILFVAACSSPSPTPQSATVPTPTPTPLKDSGVCPAHPMNERTTKVCYTPSSLRQAYGVDDLVQRGLTGKGQTVVVIVSFGSPILQQDFDVFNKQYNLPALQLQIVSPLGTVPFDVKNDDMDGWAGEATLDVEMIHAIAPGAKIVVMTSPVSETEGTVGLPEFLKLEQYAASHHLGNVFSQSWAASEATLSDPASRQFIQQYSAFYQQITTHQGITVLSGTGDQGATDATDMKGKILATSRTVNFPADVPWVTAVGGTTLLHTGNTFMETAWSGSGGGTSALFSEPDYQRSLPQKDQALLAGRRGLPDIAADANITTQVAFYFAGQWQQIGGTSASTPLCAGIVAIADQMAGHGLGFLNAALYKLAQSPKYQTDFRDVTVGNNDVHRGRTADQPQPVQVTGFQALPGWDGVTGLGAPLGDHLLADLIQTLRQS